MTEDEAVARLEIAKHSLGMDDEPLDDPREAVEHVVEGEERIGDDDSLGRGLGDVALVPERHVLEPDQRVGAHDAGEAADALGDLRVALVRHRRRALHPLAEGLFDLAHLGAREMADLRRETVERRRREREGRQQLGVTVARDHLRGEWVGLEAESVAGGPLDVRLDLGVGPDGPGELADAVRLERSGNASPGSVELERPTGELPAESSRLGVNTVRAPDADGVAMLVRSCHNGCERPVDAGEDEPPGVLDPQGKGGVHDVRGGQPIVEPAPLGPELFRDGVDKCGGVVVGDAFDLGHALRRRGDCLCLDFRHVGCRNGADLGPPLERSELDLEPARELALVRPDPGHLRARVARDHWADSRDTVGPRIRAARTAAFFALSTPTHATGTPGGIWTMESKASSPSSTPSEERSGTPMTGRSECAASTPGNAAARPAPAMSTRSPRSLAVRPYSATASGWRCAERTSNSCAIPRASSSSIAACMRSRSDSEPTTMPTSGLDMCHGRDVLAIAHVGKGDAVGRAVGKLARSHDVVADARHVENPAAIRDEAVALACSPCVKDERSFLLGLGDTVDRRADIVPCGIFTAGEYDGDRGSVCDREVGVR